MFDGKGVLHGLFWFNVPLDQHYGILGTALQCLVLAAAVTELMTVQSPGHLHAGFIEAF